MAGREKKPALLKKQNISANPNKDGDPQTEAPAEKHPPVKSNTPKQDTGTTTALSPAVKQVLKSKKTNQTNKTLKKNIKIKFKAKNKNTKKLKLSKSIFKNNKLVDSKNITIVKNGIKRKGKQAPKQTKNKSQTAVKTENKVQNEDLLPPVLEPMTILPQGNVTPKKETKKRTKKQLAEDANDTSVQSIDIKKMRLDIDETIEDVLNDVANELQLDLESLMKKPTKKPRVTKKALKTPVVKQKKPPTPKKTKAETTKGKKSNKKDIIIATLTEDFDMDSDAQNVINKLDLNVSKTIKKGITKKRRHSIEKFASVSDNNQENPNFEQPFSLFTTLRRSASPKSKRNARIRQSVDTIVAKRFSPYSTRSDSPARILRNGKQRKLKGSQLLDGLEHEYKRRKRLCSDMTSSEYLSESDSNFSDMTTITENGTCDTPEATKEEGVMTKSDLLRKEILDSITPPVPDVSELQNLNIKQISTKFTAILKRSLSTETSQLNQDNSNNEEVKPKHEDLISNFTDTNSNDVKPKVKTDLKKSPATSTLSEKEKDIKTDISCDSVKIKKEEIDEHLIEKIASSPSYKVPEKSFILDQMKQIFNDSTEDLERRTTRSSVKRSLKLSTSEEQENVPVVKTGEVETSKIQPEKKEKTENTVILTEVIEKINTRSKETTETSKPAISEEKPEILKLESGIIKEKTENLKEKPKITKETSEILKEKPKDLKEISEILKEKPKVSKETSEILKEKSKGLKETSEILKEKPKVLKETSDILKEKPKDLIETEILKERPKVSKETAEVLKEKSKDLKETSESLKEKPKVSKETSDILKEKPKDLIETEILKERPKVSKEIAEVLNEKQKCSKETEILTEKSKEISEIIKVQKEILNEKPESSEIRTQIEEKLQSLIKNTQPIEEKPHTSVEKSHTLEEIPKHVEEKSNILEEKLQISQEKQINLKEKPQILEDKPQTSETKVKVVTKNEENNVLKDVCDALESQDEEKVDINKNECETEVEIAHKKSKESHLSIQEEIMEIETEINELLKEDEEEKKIEAENIRKMEELDMKQKEDDKKQKEEAEKKQEEENKKRKEEEDKKEREEEDKRLKIEEDRKRKEDEDKNKLEIESLRKKEEDQKMKMEADKKKKEEEEKKKKEEVDKNKKEEEDKNKQEEDDKDKFEDKNKKGIHEDLLNKLRENSAISISVKETTIDSRKKDKEKSKEKIKEPVKVKIKEPVKEKVRKPVKEKIKFQEIVQEIIQETEKIQETVEDIVMKEWDEPISEYPSENKTELVKTDIEQSTLEPESEAIIEPIDEQIKKPIIEPVTEKVKEMETQPIIEEQEEIQEASKEIINESKYIETTDPITEKLAEDIILENIISSPAKEEKLFVETPENQAIKESILRALGLQSLKAVEEAKTKEKPKPGNKNDVYTGTLKTVIKLNRNVDKKKGRNPLKMTLQKSKSRSSKDGDCDNLKTDGASGRNDGENACYKVMKETGSTSGWRHGSHSSDTAGANRKSHYSNRSNLDGSSEHASDNDAPAGEGEGTSDAKVLVIPEKASSFSIHPGRLCSDECAYCFGKFGLFDTPLHIAQIKSVERQDKILENEVYLMRDSCLCDACYRHVDRRNTGSCNTKTYKRNSTTSTVTRPNYCHVMGCGCESTNVLRRKWLMKMRKSVAKLINIDLDNPSLHSIPVCAEHYGAVEHLMVCALCKRRLARNHIHYLGSECDMLNSALQKEGIPVTLTDKPVVCKLCRYFASLLLKPPPSESQSNTAEYFRQYKKRLLHFHDIETMEEGEAEEPIAVPAKEKNDKEVLKKKSKNKPSKSKLNTSGGTSIEPQPVETEKTDQTRVPSNSENGESRASTPSDTVVDYETLVPNLSLECSDLEEKETKNEVPLKQMYRKIPLPESVREAVEISKIMKIKKSSLVERLGSNPSISVRQLFQGEEDLPLQANIDFSNIKERTPEGWEKNICTIQYDTDTKHLWQELQKPYGNQSSFLRHLILLEKYFRNGDLTLSPTASHHAVNYSVSVQNRLRAYDNIPSNSVPMQPLTMLPFNQVKKSQSGIITTRDPAANISAVINAANLPKNTPIPISQLNPNFLSHLSVRQKTQSVPPGLISLQPGTNRPVASIKGAQKMKVPVGKNWKPTLIPLTNSSPQTDRRVSGLVQVISGGKPYHISLQDYNKMCYLKRNQEIKRMAENKAKSSEQAGTHSSILKPVIPRKQKAVTITATKTSSSVKESTSTSATSNPVEIIKETNGSPQDINIKSSKSVMILPKIPKSLTVIPQTVVRKPPQPSSPTLSITSKPSTSKS